MLTYNELQFNDPVGQVKVMHLDDVAERNDQDGCGAGICNPIDSGL